MCSTTHCNKKADRQTQQSSKRAMPETNLLKGGEVEMISVRLTLFRLNNGTKDSEQKIMNEYGHECTPM